MNTRDSAQNEPHNQLLMANTFWLAMIGAAGFVGACSWILAT